MSWAASSGRTSRLLTWCSGRSGFVLRTRKARRETGGIDLQHELVEQRAALTGKMLQGLDERGLGEVLPYHDVESAAQMLTAQSKAKPSGVHA